MTFCFFYNFVIIQGGPKKKATTFDCLYL